MNDRRRHGGFRARSSGGQALVEFALVAPLFFLLVFAIIEGGRFILYYETLNNATREGARYAIVHGSNSVYPSGPMPPGMNPPGCYDPLGLNPPGCYDPTGANVVQRVKDTAFGLLGTGVVVTPTWGALGNGREADVNVAATFTYRTLAPFVPLPPITMTAESTLVINN
jgi:hypothetical protein